VILKLSNPPKNVVETRVARSHAHPEIETGIATHVSPQTHGHHHWRQMPFHLCHWSPQRWQRVLHFFILVLRVFSRFRCFLTLRMEAGWVSRVGKFKNSITRSSGTFRLRKESIQNQQTETRRTVGKMAGDDR